MFIIVFSDPNSHPRVGCFKDESSAIGIAEDAEDSIFEVKTKLDFLLNLGDEAAEEIEFFLDTFLTKYLEK